jgi:hypothetical protein
VRPGKRGGKLGPPARDRRERGRKGRDVLERKEGKKGTTVTFVLPQDTGQD